MTVTEIDLSMVTAAIPPAVLAEVRAAAGVGGRVPCRVVDRRLAPGETSHVLFETGGRHVVGSIAEGQLSLAPIEADSALPGLALLHDQSERQRLVDDWLPPTPSGAARLRMTLLRYRPGRRVTYLVTRTSIGPARSLVRDHLILKLYNDARKARAVHAEMSALVETSRSTSLVLAAPTGLDPSRGIVGQEFLSGRPLAPLIVADRSEVRSGVTAAASALVSLHELVPVTERHRPLRHALEKLCRRADALASLHPAQCRPLVDLGARLRLAADRFGDPAYERCMVHGDAKADQFLVRPTDVALLDFDHCGIGDPAADVADFASKIVQRSLASGRPSRPVADSLSAAFVHAYRDAARSGPSFPTRVGLHASAALGRRALRSFQRAPSTRLGPLLIAEANATLDRLHHGDHRQ